MGVEVLLLVAVTATFAALTVLSNLRYRRRRQRATGLLTLVFGGMTLAAAGGTGLSATPDVEGGEDDPVIFLLLLVVGIVVYMVALYLFGSALEPVPRGSTLAVVATSVGLLVLIAGALVVEDTGPAGRAILPGAMAGLLALWTLVHVVAGTAVWRSGGRLSSNIARLRARHMLLGVVGMALALLAAFVPGLLAPEDETGQTIDGGEGSIALPLGLAAVAALGLSIGFAPPRWLRVVWAQSEATRLVSAELALQHTPTAEVLEQQMLPEVCAIASGKAAWFLHDGSVTAVHGASRTEALAGPRPTGGDDELTTVRGDDGAWYVLATSGRGSLVVRTDEEPVLYGVGDLDALVLLAARITSILDRSWLAQREAAARSQLDEARHLERMAVLKDDVLSTLSHELRTPLVTLCGATEVLDSHWKRTSEDQRRALIGRIRANADDLRGLVEDTLDLASMRTAEATLLRRSVPVRDVVEGVLADARFAGRAERIERDLPADLEVRTDPAALGRILRQLVTNAMKFSSRGATIVIRARADGDVVRLEVEDEGSGMAPEEMAQVFEPFYRAGDVLTRDTRGLGVGLTLARETARQLGATIEVVSRPGDGSRFTVVLPRDRRP